MRITLLALCLFLSGCARLFNKPQTVMYVRATKPALVMAEGQTYELSRYPTPIRVQRSGEPLVLVFFTDSVRQAVEVPAKRSVAFWSNVYFNLGLGMLVDQHTDKRFSYPRHLKWDERKGLIHTGVWEKPVRGMWRVNLSIPYVNNFRVRPEDSTLTRWGFFGLGTGVEYFPTARTFWALDAGAATAAISPVPAPVDYRGPHESFNAVYLRLSHHHLLRRFDFGYGAHFTRYGWKFRDYSEDVPPAPDRKVRIKGFGLALLAKYEWRRQFYWGVNYQPAFWTSGGQDSGTYQHLLSFEFGWKFRLR